jgi:flagellar biosynthesis anti-sigma factor FlgM
MNSGGINGVGGNPQIQKIVNNPIYRQVPTASSPARGGDRVELSGVEHLLKSLQAGGDVRTDKVAAIKAQIENGTYEDDTKLNGAIDRLLNELTL